MSPSRIAHPSRTSPAQEKRHHRPATKPQQHHDHDKLSFHPRHDPMTTTKKKTTPTVAGERAGRLLAKRPTIKRLATAVDTVGLREYLRLSIAWLDGYRAYTALADRSAFMQAAARVVSEKTGVTFRLP